MQLHSMCVYTTKNSGIQQNVIKVYVIIIKTENYPIK